MGFDEGAVMIKIGREEPVASMDVAGKIIWARHNDIQTVNIKALGADAEEVLSWKTLQIAFQLCMLHLCCRCLGCMLPWQLLATLPAVLAVLFHAFPLFCTMVSFL